MSPMVERFWTKVDRAAGCWEWRASRSRGYGQLYARDGRMEKAHRVSWEIHNGPVPEGLFVLHRCDNRGCVNPNHLFLGDSRANIEDMYIKRQVRFVVASAAKLSVKDVKEIRRRLCRGDPQGRIAEDLGVCQATVSHIKSRRTWGWLREAVS